MRENSLKDSYARLGGKRGNSTMASSVDLQELVNGLAARLGRSVAIDDHQIRLIVASKHFGDEDEVRVQSVMGRAVSAELVSQLAPFGLAKLTTGTHIPAVKEFGLQPRWCIPIRWNEVLMGFLWLIDDGTISHEDKEAAAALAEHAGLILYRLDAAFERRQADQNAIMRDLLSREQSVRSAAIIEIEQEGIIGDSREIHVAVIDAETVDGAQDLDSMLLSASRDLLSGAPNRSLLCQVRPRGLTVLLSGPIHSSKVDGYKPLENLQQIAKSIAFDSGVKTVVGVGSKQHALSGARSSYDQAKVVSRVASTVKTFGLLTKWEELGVYSLLGRVNSQDLELSNYPQALLELAASKNPIQLLETVEHYLDLAGDAQQTATALHIHRATLYQRLAKIEEISGLDMRNGADRLSLHLGIKLARLSGQYQQLIEFGGA